MDEIISKIGGLDVLIEGYAGYGKSFVLKALIDFYENIGSNVTKLVYTNVLREQFQDSKTLHSGLGFNIRGCRSKYVDWSDKKNVLIIDEISLVPIMFYRELIKIKREHPDIIIVLCGDFGQLPPVGQENLYFENFDVLREIVPNRLTLKVEKRSCNASFEDSRILSEQLQKARQINTIDIDVFETIEKRSINKDLLYEKIDIRKLKTLIDNFDYFYEELQCHLDKDSPDYYTREQLKTIMTKYYRKKLETDKIQYKFTDRLSWGRRFGKGGSLQSMARIIRHTISREFYYDIDMKNAHPCILLNYCKINKLKTPVLQEYILNRDELLGDLMEFGLTRDQAKTFPLTIMNGGKRSNRFEDPPKWLVEFEKEMMNVRKYFINTKEGKPMYKRALKKKKKNPDGSAMNYYLCQQENIILTFIQDYLNDADIEIGALCFDGLMVYKKDIKDVDFLVEMLNGFLADEGFNYITLSVKPMDNYIDFEKRGIRLSELPKSYEPEVNKKSLLKMTDVCRHLSYTNKTRKEINRVCMNYHKRLKDHMVLKVTEEVPKEFLDKKEYAQDTFIYKGLPIICKKNTTIGKGDDKVTIYNGYSFEVIDFNEKTIDIKKIGGGENETYSINATNFVYKFNPRYCQTIHSVQGQTIREPFCLWDIEKYPEKMLYTALSRTTKLQHVLLGC